MTAAGTPVSAMVARIESERTMGKGVGPAAGRDLRRHRALAVAAVLGGKGPHVLALARIEHAGPHDEDVEVAGPVRQHDRMARVVVVRVDRTRHGPVGRAGADRAARPANAARLRLRVGRRRGIMGL